MDQQSYLDLLKEIRDGKDIDKIGELFLTIVSMYGLTMDEVASISYYLVENTIKAKHNEAFIRDRFNIDVNILDINGIQTIQRALIAAYIDKARPTGAP